MENISKIVKFRRVFKKKLFMPIMKAIGLSFVLYFIIGNSIFKHDINDSKPHFIISTISTKFDNIEYTHLLLSIQAICKNEKDKNELIQFVNSSYPNACSKNLKKQLFDMNWEPLAFQSRVKKLFEFIDTYDRLNNLENTISFLKKEIYNEQLPREMLSQVNVLEIERDKIYKEDISEIEYNFIKEHYGFIERLRVNNI